MIKICAMIRIRCLQNLQYSSYSTVPMLKDIYIYRMYLFEMFRILVCIKPQYYVSYRISWFKVSVFCSKCQCLVRKPFGSFSKVTLTYIPVPLFIVNVCQEGLWQEPHSSIDFLLFRGCLDSHASIGCWASPAWQCRSVIQKL